MDEFKAILQSLTGRATPGATLATLVAAEGSSYRRPGARLLVTADGQRVGSISGGCLEQDIVARSRRVASTGLAELVTYDTTSENDLVWGVGLGCHGVVRVLVERLPPSPTWAAVTEQNIRAHLPTVLSVVWDAADPGHLGTCLESDLACSAYPVRVFRNRIDPPLRLYVFGAGDDAQPLATQAQQLGWHVTIADPRTSFASAERFPTADAVVSSAAMDLVDRVDPKVDGVAVIMTHHYVHDVPLLKSLLQRKIRYVGLLGPKKRAERLLADLSRDGFVPSAEALARFHAPVGLDLGAEAPAEVALSIIAEIRACLAGRDARPLRDRSQPIHT